jgi:hypothetical protein
MIHVGSRHQDKDKNQDDDLDISIESLFNNEEAMLSTTNGKK